MHSAPELTAITVIAVAATLCGMAMVRLRQPPIIGYIFAGLILGPGGMGLVENRETVSLLAEMGVVLLLYFIGMELSLRSFKSIWRIALITTGVQIGAALIAMFGLAQILGWPIEQAILFAFCLGVSSTAVAVKVMAEMGELRTRVGKVAVGILITQDLAVAPMMMILSGFGDIGSTGGAGHFIWIGVEVAISIGLFGGLIYYLTRRQRIHMPFHQLLLSKADLAPLAALTWCFGFAALAGLFGLSPAFGAFLAGLFAGNTQERLIVQKNAEPVQAILLMVFFLSIGLLIDFTFIMDNIGVVLLFWLFVSVFKTGLTIVTLRLQGEDARTSFMTALLLGQLGEFSFILADIADGGHLIPEEVHKMVVAVTVLSLITTPLFIDAERRMKRLHGEDAVDDNASSVATVKRLYSREWAWTKNISKMLWHLLFRLTSWGELRLDKIRKATRRRLNTPKAKTKKLVDARDRAKDQNTDA